MKAMLGGTGENARAVSLAAFGEYAVAGVFMVFFGEIFCKLISFNDLIGLINSVAYFFDFV